MEKLQNLIERIKSCDDAIKADPARITIKAAEELGELASEVLKFQSSLMRKNVPDAELIPKIRSTLEDTAHLSIEERIAMIRDVVKRRSSSIDDLLGETVDVIITVIALPLYHGATAQQVTDALEAGVRKFEKRVSSQQYQTRSP